MQAIAVLPIKNLTGDPSKQYLADGLTELLVAHLARLPGLHVTSAATMGAVRGFADSDKALAEKLGVRLLLAGSVLQADDRIALSVNLIDPREGRAIWGTELERSPSNILGARSEIGTLVAARLSAASPVPAGPVRQLKADAQDAFLRGLGEVSTPDTTHILAAVDLFGRAVSLEPEWAEPLAQLALAQQLAIEFSSPFERNQRAQVVKANALRAIQLDPTLPASYMALASVQAYHDWDFPAAETTLRQGLAANPGDGAARVRLGMLLAATGRVGEAVNEGELARDAEPLVPDRHGSLAMLRYYAHDFERALADADRALSISPGYALGFIARGRILAAMDRDDEAIASLRSALSVAERPSWLALLGSVYAKAGRVAEVNEVLRQLREFEKHDSFISIDNYAYIAAYQGKMDEAFRLLNEATDRRMTNVLWLAVDPRADVLRGDPRFTQLITRMGVTR
jgi:TolB-like protein